MGVGAVLGTTVLGTAVLGAGLLVWGALPPDAVASAMSVVESPVVVATAVPPDEMTDEMTDSVEVIEEIPEEILRTEIITEARSPLTGEPLNATEYAQLEAQLAEPAGGNLVSEELRYLIFLLQLRQAVKPILPFIN